jgi:hypothetical protein
MKKYRYIALLFSLILFGCGGGGGSNGSNGSNPSASSSGIVIGATDGSAMSYASITVTSLVDTTSSNVTADANGNINAPTNVTYPALVKAQSLSGGKVNYGYISSGSQTQVPVNPLSTLILSIASNGNPALITSTNQLTASSITQAKNSVNSIFSSIFQSFGVSGVDLLASNFTANHTGIDLILDAVSISFDTSGNPTLCTKIFNACKVFSLSALDTTPITLSASELSAIRNAPFASCSQLLGGLTSTSISSNSSLYSSNFLNSGLNSTNFMQAMTAKFNGISANFLNPTYLGTDANNNYVFQYDLYNTTTNQFAGRSTIPVNVVGGNCVLVGDQLPFWIQVGSQIVGVVRVDSTHNANGSAVETGGSANNPNLVVGLKFSGGGDGMGGNSVQDTVTVNGSPVTIQKTNFSFCNSLSICSSLISMTKSYSGTGYYYTPGGVNTIPVESYSAAGITSPSLYYNSNTAPIKVDLLDSNNAIQKTVNLRVSGTYINSNGLSGASLPSVSNATSILSTNSLLVNPTLTLNIPSGMTVQSVTLSSGPSNGTVTNVTQMVLSSSNTNQTVTKTIDPSTDTYRSITINGNTHSGIPFSIKYVYAPSCSGCT